MGNMDYTTPAAVRRNRKIARKVHFSETVRIVLVEKWIEPDLHRRKKERFNRIFGSKRSETQRDDDHLNSYTSQCAFEPQVFQWTMNQPSNYPYPIATAYLHQLHKKETIV